MQSLPQDERDLARVAWLHTLWAVFLGCAAVYYMAGPLFGLVKVAETNGMSGVIGGVVVGAGGLAVMGALIVAHLVAAFSVRQKKRRAHATFMSFFLCMAFPFGTMLGMYSLAVLNRPSVRALFLRSEQPPTADLADARGLDGLATFHFGYSAFLVFMLLLGVWSAVRNGIETARLPGRDPAEIALGLSVLTLPYVAILLVLIPLQLLAAVGLEKRKYRAITYLASVLALPCCPLGTLLGILTLVTLEKTTVKALYPTHS